MKKGPTITPGPFVLLLLLLQSFTGAGVSAQAAAESLRICLAFPAVEFAVGDAAQAAEAVRTTFAAYLTGPSIEPVSLMARTATQATQEAQQRDCAHVLHTTVVLKRGGRSVLGRAARTLATPAATHVAVGSSMGATARATAISGVYAAAELASSIRAKDEVTFEYRLVPSSGGPAVDEGSSKARARSDGEDLLTPLIAAAAETIAARLARP
jgi:hypothetical protein